MAFQVGYSRVCITPTTAVPLGGYGNTSRRISASVDSDLYCTCLAFTGTNNETILVLSCDLGNTLAQWSDPGRLAASRATGVPYDHILVASTHTHEAPDHYNEDFESIAHHRRAMVSWIEESARLAMADRSCAQLFIGTTKIETVSYVRHYVLADGSYAGDNFGDFDAAPILNSTTEADRVMQILKITRPDKADIIAVNWQTHPHRSGGATRTEISADIVGGMREAMEARTGCLFAYFTGASGNINTRSRTQSLNLVGDHRVCGSFMADHVIAALPDLQPLSAGPVRAIARVCTAAVNHTQDHLTEVAAALRADWARTNDTAACIAAGKPYGIHSPYHAKFIVEKAAMAPTMELPIWVLSAGDLSFIGAPYEMFDTTGSHIKQASPFAATFVCSCTNDHIGYLPSAYAFRHGCYEADCTPLAPGTAEDQAMEFISMLCAIKSQGGNP